MATIYRFIVENKQGSSRDSSKPRASKGAAKKGKYMPLLFSGDKGGVEHNRKLRAINPILNKVTNGVWEKGMRLTRAGGGLIQRNTETGNLKIGGPSIAIIVAMLLIAIWDGFARWNQRERERAEKANTQNFKAMENGGGSIHGAYNIVVNGWSGHINYNENK